MSAAREIRRLRYLQAMGVNVYVSRRPLPGAAPTLKLCFKVGPGNTRNARLASTLDDPAHGASIARDSLLPESLARRGRSASTAQTSVPPQEGAVVHTTHPDAPSAAISSRSRRAAQSLESEAAPAIEHAQDVECFRLAVVVCAARVWIEDLGNDALATDQLKLIGAIAHALTHPDSERAAPKAAQFVWPVHDNQQLDLGAGEASASLQGYLSRQLDEHACVEVICLGEAAAQRLRPLSLPCARRELASTREMLSNPRLKSAFWRNLRS